MFYNKTKIKTVIHVSTDEVYGDMKDYYAINHSASTDSPLKPSSYYSSTKASADLIVQSCHKTFGLPYLITRTCNNFGKRQHPEKFIPKIFKNIKEEQPIPVYGDGKQTRSFCYVSDLVEGIYKLLQLKDNPNTPINLGNPNEFTILELAKVVIEITNSKSEIVNNPLPLDDPKQRCPDISLAKSTLNWKPTIELREGIEKTAAYFKQII